MTDPAVPIEQLYARFEALVRGRTKGDGRAAHDAVLDRLAANRAIAERDGWTSCALERAAGMGRLRMWGVPPNEGQRHPIPDWPAERR